MDSIYEVSFNASDKLEAYVNNHIDTDRSECSDPFDLVSEKEEEEGHPMVW